jgi:AcrR family transcriptional regulator
MKRAYAQTQRAQMAVETRLAVLEAVERLLRREWIANITIATVAAEAAVSQQTIFRLFGDKDALFDAVSERIAGRVQHQRAVPAAGDVTACVRELVAHYEAEGDWVWNALRQEDALPAWGRAGLASGRRFHRAWVARAFFAHGEHTEHTELVDALLVATDLYAWKLLRRDLGRSAADVERTMIRTVTALLAAREGASKTAAGSKTRREP